MDSRAEYIDKVLGFYLKEPFAITLKLFSNNESMIKHWYSVAKVYEKIYTSNSVQPEEKLWLFMLLEDAYSECEASNYLGEHPDTESVLGLGYDIPSEFVEKWQPIIWEHAIAEFKS
jgi:hypothetical protein